MEIDRSMLFKLYYLCLIVVVIAGLAVHFMEAPEAPEVPEVHEGAGAPEVHEEETHEAPGVPEEGAHEAEGAEEGFWWLHIPLFAAFFAFLGGVVLLALSKLGVYPLIKREETYYEEHSFKKGGEQ
jgi:predicted cobalt transporter CbtA